MWQRLLYRNYRGLYRLAHWTRRKFTPAGLVALGGLGSDRIVRPGHQSDHVVPGFHLYFKSAAAGLGLDTLFPGTLYRGSPSAPLRHGRPAFSLPGGGSE